MVLASQYDPLGYIVPFTTRAKILVQDLWKEQIGWDDPSQPQSLCDRWLAWEPEIPDLIQMEILRSYVPASTDSPTSSRDLHIFQMVLVQGSHPRQVGKTIFKQRWFTKALSITHVQ